ncbi:transcriptional repressor NF-X1-like [Lytechinus variegatus]|uniref:transcriptional repressor NF-X1-like n=1 Tax=Lytechinus variegatus TaxID=7654 RepID=UPI001BB22C38|nr:transcriptional repressor NF-X1-like [Lytechinus variegatus]XP_041478843.1 transcriptional repressor NF-X1-like [Lytechinus variegatus]
MAAQERSDYEKGGRRGGDRNRNREERTSSSQTRTNQRSQQRSSRNHGPVYDDGYYQPGQENQGQGYYRRDQGGIANYYGERRNNGRNHDQDYASQGRAGYGVDYFSYSHYPNEQHFTGDYRDNQRWHDDRYRPDDRQGVATSGGNQQEDWRWEDSRHPPRGGRGGGRGRGGRRGRQQYGSKGPDRDAAGEFDNRAEGRRYSDSQEEWGRDGNRGRGRGGRQRGRGKGNRESGRSHHADREMDQSRPQARKSRDYPDRDSSGAATQDRKDIDNYVSHIQGTRWQNDRDIGQQDKNRSRSNSNEDSKNSDRDNPRNRSAPSHRGKGNSQASKLQKGTRKPKISKAGNAETQTGSLIEQLSTGSYECAICCDRVKAQDRVWSCKTCYVVFHLGCIKKWAKTPAASAEGTDGWQCPACRGVEIKIPHVYYCFCGKTRDPMWEPGETPHSCGEVCRRKRPTSCPHTCNILCHPGPCPPCPSNVQKLCNCGKTQQTVRCGTQNEIRCQKKCGKLLNCGRHTCEEICHKGQCSPCEEKIVQECYCGGASREVDCQQEVSSTNTKGSYSCLTVCNKLLDCGHHHCESVCHAGECEPCSRDPARVTHCPCGKTPLSSLCGVERTSCTDPIPTCLNRCEKVFLCGGTDKHICEQTCHSGACPACEKTTNMKCRCGHRFVDVPCKDIQERSEVICDRKCTRKKHCGRHKCGQICCVDADHLCLQQCGRKLKCGIHTCEEPCHMGNCPPCLNASFDELTCHCGQEILYPPIPCGTPPPECHQPCNRRHACQHPVRHHCHSEEKCPPCVELTSKTCIGGHEVRYNIPCHVQGISCGRPCGKPLPCGYHNCLKTCHTGECDPECKQPCKVIRPDCGHPCGVTCHVGWPCPQITCKSKVTVKCPCGRRVQMMECQASGSDGINKALQKLTVSKLAGKIQTLQRNEDIDISELTGAKGSNKASRLMCDEECSLQERNKRLAVALQIKNPEMSASNNTTQYGDFLKEQARKHPGFVAAIEKEFAALVVSAQSSKQASRSHAFPSMIKNHRRIIHELSEFYGCESESYDEEPKRNVVTTARKNRCFMPNMTLTAMIQRELNPRAPLPIPHGSQENKLRSAAKAIKLSTDVVSSSKTKKEKVIDYFDMTS